MTDQVTTPVPYNIVAEEALLGGIILDHENLARVREYVQPEDFYMERLGTAYAAAIHLQKKVGYADLTVLVAECVRRMGTDSTETYLWLTDLAARTPTSSFLFAEYNAAEIARLATLRRQISVGGEIAALAYDTDPGKDPLAEARERLEAVEQRRPQSFTHIEPLVSSYFDKVEAGPTNAGIPTGFFWLDKVTGGLQRNDLVLIAGRPGHGKTSISTGILRNSARYGSPGAIFSLEMKREELVGRLLSEEAGIDGRRLDIGEINDNEWARLQDKGGRLSKLPIYINDRASQTVETISTATRRVVREYGVSLVIIDYIQLVEGTDKRERNRVQEVTEISRGLKKLTMELDICVVACAQLSRAVEHRKSNEPVLSDLRESGSLEQDADIVMFIHREELYDRETDKKGLGEVIIAKHRSGPLARIPLRWVPQLTAFQDIWY
ncbi:MAG TPA: replicative DNA helicase [Chloroflexia bacterium]|jgi:replicative DNA helicase